MVRQRLRRPSTLLGTTPEAHLLATFHAWWQIRLVWYAILPPIDSSLRNSH